VGINPRPFFIIDRNGRGKCGRFQLGSRRGINRSKKWKALKGGSDVMKAVYCDHVSKYFHVGRERDGEGNGRLTGGNGNGRKSAADLFNRIFGKNGSRKAAVKTVSLQVTRGEVFGILGPNGCGKSTLVRMISTLLIPDEGQVRVFGRDVIRDKAVVRWLISRVSVDAAFFKTLSPYENLRYSARLYGLSAAAARNRAWEILEKLGFPEKSFTRPMDKCSRGMQQKVAIARAFLTTPKLILMDEPTTGLDPVSKRRVQEFLTDLRSRTEVTILLTSHDMEEADRLCDRVAIMNDGAFVASDTPERLKAKLPGGSGTLEDVFFELTGEKLEEKEEN